MYFFQTFWLLYRVLGCLGGSGRSVRWIWCMFRPILRSWGRAMTIFMKKLTSIKLTSIKVWAYSIKKSVSRPQEVSPGRISRCRIRIWGPKCLRTGSRASNWRGYEISKFWTFTKHTKMVITRPHDLRFGRNIHQIHRTDLPERPRQPRSLYNSQKVWKHVILWDLQILKINKKIHKSFFSFLLKGSWALLGTGLVQKERSW